MFSTQKRQDQPDPAFFAGLSEKRNRRCFASCKHSWLPKRKKAEIAFQRGSALHQQRSPGIVVIVKKKSLHQKPRNTMPDIRVAAGGKIAVLAHCFLNQNTKPYQRARYPGIVTPVLEALQQAGFALMQLPCPEISFAGMRRWSQVIEQYDTPKYREHCHSLAAQSVDQIDHFLRDRSFFLVMIGLEGSPSCGIHHTGSSAAWRGYPGDIDFDGKYPVEKGTGLFMQSLQKEIKERGLTVPPTVGVGLDMYGIDLNQIGAKLREELAALAP